MFTGSAVVLATQWKEWAMQGDKRKDRSRRLGEMADDAVSLHDVMTEHLIPCGDDLTLLTLKGHLVAEGLLDMILVRLLAIPKLPQEKDARLTFYQKLELVRAVICAREPGPNADLFLAIRKLNSVRNQLAHNLKNQEKIEEDINSLIDCYYARDGKKRSRSCPLPDLLRQCLTELCLFLYRTRYHLYVLEK